MGVCVLQKKTLSLLGLILILLSTNYVLAESNYYGIGSKPNVDSAGFVNSSSKQGVSGVNKNVSSNIEKAVVIIFDRGYETQFTNAKPILDKYGFKASFFVICSFIDGNGYYELSNGSEILDYDNPMTWEEIRILQNEGHSIESHGMEHRYLLNLTSTELQNEIAGSKECLEDQGLKPTFFQFPSNKGAHNSSILKMVSENFDFGLSDHSVLMFLNCDGWVNHGFKTQSYKYQHDCRTYSEDGEPTRTNKYSIREWSHDRFHSKLNNKFLNFSSHESEISGIMFDEFVRVVESQTQYNEKAGKIVAIPIVGYHMIDTHNTYDTSIELFDKEMKYLYDNGFKILKLTDLGYDEKEHHFYIK